MAVDQLGLYNEALRLCGERSLASLTEPVKPRRLLDAVWGFTFFNAILEEGQWLFATRAVQVDYTPSVEPPFGLRYAFSKPSDWVRTTAMCSDEFFRVPLNRMSDETGFWYSDLQSIFVKYVSNDPAYGLNIAGWPPSFSLYAGAYLARQIVMSLENSTTTTAELDKEMEKRLLKALSKDAMNGPTKFLPTGSWARSRRGSDFTRGNWGER